MAIYKVFNENSVVKKVSDDDLDRAARESGALSTELANAAALAKRADLTARLIETLDVGPRSQRLAAANALLVLGHAAAAAVLEALAQREQDAVVVSMFRVIALRLKGVAQLRSAWERADDPELCSFMPSLYNSKFALGEADVDFVVSMLGSYIEQDRGWIKACPKDEVRNALFLLVNRVTAESAEALRQSLPKPLRQRLHDMLNRVVASRADTATKTAAKRALREWSTG
jgi:hypothetical protein